VLTRQGRLRGAVRDHLDSPDVARVVYGSVVGLAVVVALQVHPPTAAQAAGIVFGTGLAIGLAEIYAEIIGSETRTRRRVERRELREMLRQAGAATFGAAFPAIFFLLASAGAIEMQTAFRLAKWTGLGLICGYGFLASRLAGQSVVRALVHAAAVGAIGGALIAFKALLH
jgi:hypothetical protein